MRGRPAPSCILVTGASGFIGTNAVAWLLRERPDVRVVSFDAMTYAAHPESLPMVTAGFEDRHQFVRGDVRDGELLDRVLAGRATDANGAPVPAPEVLWHLAAETHVDRSILSPTLFVETNVTGTLRILEALRSARERGRSIRLVHVSTDEVYGSLAPDAAPVKEDAVLAPSSPYAASKAGGDLLVQAWARTYGLDAVISRATNTYGPFQFPEKLIPLMLTRALAGHPLPVYGDGRQRRDWLFVDDHVAALWAMTVSGAGGGAIFNLAGAGERENLAVVRQIVADVGADPGLITQVRDRPAHDRRYALDSTKLRAETGWTPRVEFADGLSRSLAWYRAHPAWWRVLLPEASRAADALYFSR